MSNGIIRFSQISQLTGLKRQAINARAKNIFEEKELQRSKGNHILLNSTQVKRLIEDRLISQKGKIIYTGNLKGGVGKTTLSYLLINAISMMGLKTCAIDLDVQANLTRQYVDINVEQPVFYDIIENRLHVKDVIMKVTPTLDIIPSSLKNSLIPKSLAMQAPKHHLTWFNALCLDYLRENYDVILVDTPPHLSSLNSVFCLCLGDGDHIAIPACAEEFSIMGVQMFLEDILAIRESYQTISSPKISIIMNRFFQTQKTNLEMLVAMSTRYGDMLSEVVIRDSAKIREVINNKTPIGEIKQGKDVYETIANLLQEFEILKRNDG
jgi:chromosome partitioning protein